MKAPKGIAPRAHGRKAGGVGNTELVFTGDGISGLASLAHGSVDLVLADLPSGQTNAQFDIPLDLSALWDAIAHATHPHTTIVLMASNMRYAAKVVASNEAQFRYDLVWWKNRPTGHLNVKRQPLRAHEYLLVFYQKPPVYHPQKTQGHRPMNASNTRTIGVNYGVAKQRKTKGGSTERYSTSVLPFPVVRNNSPVRIHPQQKPEALMEWVIRSFTVEGDLVVDPCAGSGTTGRAALACGRRFLGWELNE